MAITNKKLFISLVSILISVFANAQKADAVSDKALQSFYVEGGGPGLLTINYDQRLKGRSGLGFRAGMGGYGIGKKGLFTVPIGLNYTIGSGNDFAEIGAGLCYMSASEGNYFFDNTGNFISAYFNFGYRYQPQAKKLSYRIFLSPLFTPAGIVPFYAGASIGIKF